MAHLAAQLGVAHPTAWPDEVRLTKSLYRYQAAVRTHLSVTAYDAAAEQMLASTVLDAAETMSDPADLINRAIEALQAAAIDLPAFSTLDRLVNRLRAEVHGRMYGRIAARLLPGHMATLDTLLARLPGSVATDFNRLKQAPGPATPTTVRLWTDRLAWLDGLIDPDPPLEGSPTPSCASSPPRPRRQRWATSSTLPNPASVTPCCARPACAAVTS